MSTISKSIAALAFTIGIAGPVLAQDTPPATVTPPDQTMPPPSSATTDMSGQTLYNTDGHWIGNIVGTSTDAHGQRLAAVQMKHKSTTVLVPVGSLQPREKGGYMTNLDEDQIKQLPKANATNTP